MQVFVNPRNRSTDNNHNGEGWSKKMSVETTAVLDREPADSYSPQEVEIALALDRAISMEAGYRQAWRAARLKWGAVAFIAVLVSASFLVVGRNDRQALNDRQFSVSVSDRLADLENKVSTADALAEQRRARIQELENKMRANPPVTTTVARRGTRIASPPASPAGVPPAPSTPAEAVPPPVPPPAVSAPPQATHDEFDKPRESHLLCIPGVICIG